MKTLETPGARDRKSKTEGAPHPEAALTQAGDFRSFLQAELVRRCKANPKYSLRAFARILRVEPSFLSKILSGKRLVTASTVSKFARALALDPLLTESFREAAETQRKLNRGRKTSTLGAQPDSSSTPEVDYRQLALDQFQVISEWYHFAILELVGTESFEPSSRYIARALGISVPEAASAVERLFRLQYLERLPDGRWKNASGSNTTLGNDFTVAALRKVQKQILEKAILALEEIPLEERDQTAMTLAIDSSRMAEAKQKLKEFRREFTRTMENGEKPDRVYHLCLSLYPVSRPCGTKSLTQSNNEEI